MHTRLGYLTALAAAALLMPAALASPLLNQVRNGSFEDWDAGAVPVSWTLEIGTISPSPLSTDGATSVQLRAKPNEVGNHLSIIAQAIPQNFPPAGTEDLPIVPGLFYELSFDAAGVYSGKGSGMATVTWAGALGHVLRVDTVVVPDEPEAVFHGYSAHLQAPVDATLPDAATSATVRFVVDGQSSDEKVNLWVDKVQFGLSTPV
jgi:hypothetical protein